MMFRKLVDMVTMRDDKTVPHLKIPIIYNNKYLTDVSQKI
jgi:hypothetical protein